ncbi:hypothetical protein PAPYR_9247 [Paratrimastix pyriformis]|uniref:Uncharacterized protein n=1 Tax=Paratrimastix pyriformis TaxID=342808 RepID=A0ABQ8UBG1_9EUKA|nr:hypothetical protein PAPYR_9247 [Paratrimastix pyriformis]
MRLKLARQNFANVILFVYSVWKHYRGSSIDINREWAALKMHVPVGQGVAAKWGPYDFSGFGKGLFFLTLK